MALWIDVSENNGEIDWQAVKDAGVEGVVVRSSYGKHEKDEMFEHNVSAALEAGLKVGAYHYSYALTAEDAIDEAHNCHNIIEASGLPLEFVFFDMEDADHYKANHDFNFDPYVITEICRAFIENVGYTCGVYASFSWFHDYIDWENLGCPVWNAEWVSDPTDIDESYDSIRGLAWQFTDSYHIGDKYFDGDIFRL